MSTDTAIIALVNQALIAARARSGVKEHRRNGSVFSDGHPGATLDVSHRNIERIPQGVIELIKDEIERSEQPSPRKKKEQNVFISCCVDNNYWACRLALAHNRLTSFADEFSGLVHLRYLNLRANYLQEFPLVVRIKFFLSLCSHRFS